MRVSVPLHRWAVSISMRCQWTMLLNCHLAWTMVSRTGIAELTQLIFIPNPHPLSQTRLQPLTTATAPSRVPGAALNLVRQIGLEWLQLVAAMVVLLVLECRLGHLVSLHNISKPFEDILLTLYNIAGSRSSYGPIGPPPQLSFTTNPYSSLKVEQQHDEDEEEGEITWRGRQH